MPTRAARRRFQLIVQKFQSEGKEEKLVSIRTIRRWPATIMNGDALQPIGKCFCDECVSNGGEVTMVIEKEKI
jgi:hypothetical protein